MPIAQILLASRSGTPTPTYTLTPDFANVNEGASLTFTVGGTNIPNGIYYWDITHSGTTNEDFTATSGTVTVIGNSGSFTVSAVDDATTEGSETFVVALREGSTSGTILASSGSITINDTSFAIGGQYVFDGTPTDWATTNATATTYEAFTYPNESSGSLHTLTGSQYLMSGNIGNNTVLNINLWFYPTANNLIIMGEMGQPSENSTWHYSMLDIDNTNHLRGRLWQFVGATSTGTVTLNAWNHAYLYYNSVTSSVGLSLNNETAVTINTGARQLSDTSETYLGIGILDSQNMSSNTRYQGKFDTPVINTTLVGSNYTGTKAKYLPSFSLVFNQPQGDYLSTPASADWNLGNTWTMEFWIRSNNNSASNINIPGGQWGLINQGGWYGGMPDDNCILVGMAGGYLTINQSANDDIQFTEPTTQLWTHVAIVNNGGGSAQKVYYNGVEQVKVSGNYTTNGKTNTTADLYIGRLSNQYAGYGSHFDGKMALIRISNTAKYSASFTPTVTYGVEADTKLFLNSITPLTDASASTHTITNNGTAVSGTFVNRYTALHSAGNQASSNIVIDTNPNNDAWAGSVPAGATVISQITGRFTVISTGREIGTNNWVFYIGGSNNFTAGETHTFIW
jgi:hypothetical protein